MEANIGGNTNPSAASVEQSNSAVAPVLSRSATAKPSKLDSLKCTGCGGAIEIRGGHNVKSIVCQYCGSCLDVKDSFKVLHKLLNQKRPYMPLKLGLKGKLKGANFIVIGVVQYEQREDEEAYHWLEYLLFSPTHGYVYLCFSDGHWVFMREVKEIPDTPVKMSVPRKSVFTVRDKKFQVFECARAKAVYIEGELTWEAKNGEEIRYLDAISPPYQYTMEMRGKIEVEYFWGEYLTHAEMLEGFATDGGVPASGVAPCQPFTYSPMLAGISKGALVASIIALICYFMISSTGDLLSSYKFDSGVYTPKGQVSKIFKVDKPNSLYSFVAKTPSLSGNRWTYLDIGIVNKDETKRLLSMPVELYYFSGRDSKGRWTDNRRTRSGVFKIPEAGEYKIVIYGEGGLDKKYQSDFKIDKIIVDVYEGSLRGHYTFVCFFILLLLSLVYFVKKLSFESMRWKGSDDDNEEDD